MTQDILLLFFYFFFVYHEPVLLHEVQDAYLALSRRKYIIDATQGLGGHTNMLIQHADHDAIVLGIDRDDRNIALAHTFISNIPQDITYHSVHSSFALLDAILVKYALSEIDFILYDLGVSSAHYDDGDRGFSLRLDAPLDMRFDRSTGKTAYDLIHTADAQTLKRIFYEYADEPKAHFIAEAIVAERQHRDISTTFALRDLIQAHSFDKKSPLRVFQALRIAVNDEF